MKKVTHRIETVHQDAMSTKRVMRITIPPLDTSSREAFEESASSMHREIDLASDTLDEATDARRRSVRAALKYAESEADPEAPHCSTGDLMNTVSIRLRNALAIVPMMPAHVRDELEQALNLAFAAGAQFNEAYSRERHLDDLERELSQAKARQNGRDVTRHASENENRELLIFMLNGLRKKPDGTKPKVMEVARWAAKKGLGARSGDLEKDAKANRSRYNRWLRSRQDN